MLRQALQFARYVKRDHCTNTVGHNRKRFILIGEIVATQPRLYSKASVALRAHTLYCAPIGVAVDIHRVTMLTRLSDQRLAEERRMRHD